MFLTKVDLVNFMHTADNYGCKLYKIVIHVILCDVHWRVKPGSLYLVCVTLQPEVLVNTCCNSRIETILSCIALQHMHPDHLYVLYIVSTVQRNGMMRVLAFMAWLQYVIELLLAGFDGLFQILYFSLTIIQWQVTVVVCSGCRKHNMLWSSCAVWRQCCVTSQRLCTKFVSTTLKFSWKFNFLLFGCYHWSCQDALCLANKTVSLITHTHTWLCGLHVDISLGQHPSSIVHCRWKGCPPFVCIVFVPVAMKSTCTPWASSFYCFEFVCQFLLCIFALVNVIQWS